MSWGRWTYAKVEQIIGFLKQRSEPTRSKEIFNWARKQHIGPVTVTKILEYLVNVGIVGRNQISHKEVLYHLTERTPLYMLLLGLRRIIDQALVDPKISFKLYEYDGHQLSAGKEPTAFGLICDLQKLLQSCLKKS